ncbi:type VI secretion system tube protein TssD [Acinetobacter pittii]
MAVDLQRLLRALPPLPGDAGQVQLVQQFSGAPAQVLLQRGMPAPGKGAQALDSGNPNWKLNYTPGSVASTQASPLLLAALTSGERLTKVEIQWYRTSAAGTQEHYYTTVLEDAIIVDIKDYMHNCQDPGNAHFTHLEDVHFTYRKITWTHEVSGTSGSDDWRSPVAG